MKRLFAMLSVLLALGACADDKTGGETPAPPKPTPATGNYAAVNSWMYAYMKGAYLWDEPLAGMKPDYTLDYDKFLTSLLDGVAAFKDDRGRALNYDDGHWTNGVRDYYYSYVDGPEITTRAGEELTETGLWKMTPVQVSEERIIIAIEVVTPGTPAARAGLRRGMVITHVDGQELTPANYKSLYMKCYYGPSVRVLPNRLSKNGTGALTLEPLDEVTLAAETFTDPALYRTTVVEVGGKRVGYLLYMGFETEYDEDLVRAFEVFRQNRIDELVVDLRYNGGGAVRSSTLLATLILGEEYRGKTYCRMVYNAQRTANGETGVYCIGDSLVPDGGGVYTPIAEALASAVNLRRIYVIGSENTASASELLVNGLRGFDLEVRLVGTRTNGKNVGMEGYVDYEVGGAKYTFMPITFYSENAKGFRDYSDGFEPQVTVADPEGYYLFPGDFATQEDDCFRMISQWIETGVQPVFRADETRAATPSRAARPLAVDFVRPNRHAQGSLVFKE